MKTIKILVVLTLALALEQGSSVALAKDAVAQPTLAFKAMTVPQLLARLQLPNVQWAERKHIVEELDSRPAAEVLPSLYQIFTTRGPYHGYGGYEADPYLYVGASAPWNEQVMIAK